MENKTYLVLTPEKIEDIFRDLEIGIIEQIPYKADWFDEVLDEFFESIQSVLESKKQELLKSIK